MKLHAGLLCALSVAALVTFAVTSPAATNWEGTDGGPSSLYHLAVMRQLGDDYGPVPPAPQPDGDRYNPAPVPERDEAEPSCAGSVQRYVAQQVRYYAVAPACVVVPQAAVGCAGAVREPLLGRWRARRAHYRAAVGCVSHVAATQRVPRVPSGCGG
jgi:hypothetical protein